MQRIKKRERCSTVTSLHQSVVRRTAAELEHVARRQPVVTMLRQSLSIEPRAQLGAQVHDGGLKLPLLHHLLSVTAATKLQKGVLPADGGVADSNVAQSVLAADDVATVPVQEDFPPTTVLQRGRESPGVATRPFSVQRSVEALSGRHVNCAANVGDFLQSLCWRSTRDSFLLLDVVERVFQTFAICFKAFGASHFLVTGRSWTLDFDHHCKMRRANE